MDGLAPGFEARLDVFLDHVGAALRSDTQRAAFARYTVGLLSEADRKSVEPLAACSCPDQPHAEHKRLLYLLSRAPWNDCAVRRHAAVWALWGATTAGPVRVSIIDDTGMLKRGRCSVGVARQYTGSAGKVTNCQVAVTLCVATDHDTIPLDVSLYLPQEWAADADRRRAARVPDAVTFQTKPELALAMLQAAHADGVPLGQVLLADADYGRSTRFRAGVTALGLEYGVGVHCTQRVWDAAGVWTEPMTAAAYAANLSPRHFRRLAWRTGSDGATLSSRFAFLRVVVTEEGREPQRGRDPSQWLIIEWRDGDEAPEHFYLSTLSAALPKARLVRILKERWRTERMNEDLKGEVGFDHFEGRSWPGWHHHVSAALACYALLVGERCVAFPPSTPRPSAPDADRRAA
jgi:SRSO17 transposase